MNQFDETPLLPDPWWRPPPPPAPEEPSHLTPEMLAHAAVLEQMAHGATYDGGHTDGNVVSHDRDKTDRQEMLRKNGYEPEPRLIVGKNGLQMVVYTPLPGSDVQPVVSFRGSEELADFRSDLNPEQVGDDQFKENETLVNDTMRNVAKQYRRQVEVTGHSLGGALAQIAAAHNPEVTGHLTTFQAAGVDREEVDRIEDYNRQRVAAKLPPLTADHFRVTGDVVPVAGEGFAPGDVHTFDLDAPTHIPGVGDVDLGFTDPLTAHLSHPVTAAALASAEGQAALPGIPKPVETVERIRTEDVAAENAGSHHLETARSWLGSAIEGAIGLAQNPSIAMQSAGGAAASLWDWMAD